MTGIGMFERQNKDMLNIELARTIHADRQREIEARLRIRRLFRRGPTPETIDKTWLPRPVAPPVRQDQRPTSTAAFSR
jgi:hypothetical protein